MSRLFLWAAPDGGIQYAASRLLPFGCREGVRSGPDMVCAIRKMNRGKTEPMTKDQAHFPPVDPVKAGLTGRCPRCGEGKLFMGYLNLRESCGVCGLDNSFADSGDGPAIFVMLIVGFIVVGLALWLEVNYSPALWVHMILWIPLTLILCLSSLRAMKGVLITLQYANKAQEGRLDR